jgi:hypothetical protein
MASLSADAPKLTAVLNVTMPRAVIAERLRSLIPWAAGAQAIEDAVRPTPQIYPPMPRGLGGISAIAQK